ncbi:ABC transporter permease [Uliginosibacterium sp. H1]|uniref:ABC transporter permease n=1 Tax=Uliginosibacterium sp. H1 TaxID=3114757 RepID=UPI002E198016|nr:ABC transporter permease [Uliginosibacterium sp. H1]
MSMSSAALPGETGVPHPLSQPVEAPVPSSPMTVRRRRASLWALRAGIGQRAYWALAIGGLALPLLAWIALSASGAVDKVFLPGPADVLARLQTWWVEDGLMGDIAISTWRVVAGWALSAVIALPLGLFIGSYRAVQATLEPLTDFIRYMPAVAFIPLVMLWVGIDESAKVAIIFIGTFFQMVLMVAEDVRRVPMAQIEAAQTMGASQREIIELVIVPSAKPALLDTLRVTMGWAWTYLVVAELVAASSGVGFAILKAQRFLQTDKIFAGILLIGAIGLLMDQGFRWAHRRAFPWMHGRH